MLGRGMRGYHADGSPMKVRVYRDANPFPPRRPSGGGSDGPWSVDVLLLAPIRGLATFSLRVSSLNAWTARSRAPRLSRCVPSAVPNLEPLATAAAFSTTSRAGRAIYRCRERWLCSRPTPTRKKRHAGAASFQANRTPTRKARRLRRRTARQGLIGRFGTAIDLSKDNPRDPATGRGQRSFGFNLKGRRRWRHGRPSPFHSLVGLSGRVFSIGVTGTGGPDNEKRKSDGRKRGNQSNPENRRFHRRQWSLSLQATRNQKESAKDTSGPSVFFFAIVIGI